jgi:4-amino-4-deoxy-L-arabinose transferase-like glycosyltransferase
MPNPRSSANLAPTAWILLVWTVLFALRVLGPDDLLDKDQERPAAYVQDVVINGNWIIQTDLAGDVSSKPPVYTWLCALTTSAVGRINSFSLYLAPGLATLAIALMLLRWSQRHYGELAGLTTALLYLVSAVAAKQMSLARTDGVFAFTVTLTAFLAYRAWTMGKGWPWFWLAAALATLTKGPAGLAFGAGGLLAFFWERHSPSRPRFRGYPLPGIAIYLVVAAGWFYAAYIDLGQPVIDKMIHRELLGHATGSTTHTLPGSEFYKPPLLFLARFAPWSLLAFAAFWRVWKHPEPNDDLRRSERFLFCWFWTGLGLLALGAHQRGDLLNPMIPAAAILAGREATRWLSKLPTSKVRPALAALSLIGILLLAGKYYVLRPMDQYVKQTAEIKALANTLEKEVGPEFPFSYLKVPYGLQIYLNTLHREATPERIAKLLQGNPAAFVWISDDLDLSTLTNGPAQVYLLRHIPLTKRPGLTLLSNRPTLEREAFMALCLGPLDVQFQNLLPIHLADQQMTFQRSEANTSSTLQIHNTAATPKRFSLRLQPEAPREKHVLLSAESWRTTLGSQHANP